MNNTELLTKPELAPIVEAYFDTKRDYETAVYACGWSMSLDTYYSQPKTESDFLERAEKNKAALTNRAYEITTALLFGERFADFLKMGIDLVAAEYSRELWRYNYQQEQIADAPRRAWATTHNARLAEIDRQIKSAKIRRGKTWGKWRKNEASYEEVSLLVSVIDEEIAEIEKRREVVAAERFEQVA
jgi:hypothetical protein